MNIKNIDWRAKVRPFYKFATKLPPVVRSLAGILLVGAGFLGIIMPILGFWMAPLGLLFIAADIPPLRKRVEAWLERDDDERGDEANDGRTGAESALHVQPVRVPAPAPLKRAPGRAPP